jgi:hypothetical protein
MQPKTQQKTNENINNITKFSPYMSKVSKSETQELN